MKLKLRWRPEFIRHGSDVNVGAAMWQLTSAALVSHNIYCEARYTSVDGSMVAFMRSAHGGYFKQDLWICDMRTKRIAFVCDNVLGHPATPRYADSLYFIRKSEDGTRALTRANLKSLELDEIMDLKDCPDWRSPVGSVSPDERYYVSNMRVRDNIFALYRIDLRSGKWAVLHEHAEISNPHHQYEPAKGADILVQHNRGCKFDTDGNPVVGCGQEGATLYLIDSQGGNLRPLPVGKPHTRPITGHECWVGKTGSIILTLGGAFGTELHIVSPGESRTKCLMKGPVLGHVASSDDGRFFISDDFRTGRIYVGGIKTARMLALCETGMEGIVGGFQPNHPHPYMTPDNTYVIFNSNRTGLPQLWAVEIPDGFLQALED